MSASCLTPVVGDTSGSYLNPGYAGANRNRSDWFRQTHGKHGRSNFQSST
jgi:hypothetical protein